MISVVGWDVGGANLKATWLSYARGEASAARTLSRPYEIWRDKERLPGMLRSVLEEVAVEQPKAMALTMTAELADVFATKREGVLFVMDSALSAFRGCACYALSLSGDFVPLENARAHPLDFAAANWLAAALFVAQRHPNCLLVDVGSTTTDVIPILGGQVVTQGRNDPDRLMAGELVYTGVLRTHLASIVHTVPVRGRLCPVSSEYFTISGDVHLILGHLAPEDYTCPTPDGRPPTVDSARGRLARLVCADVEMLCAAEIDEMARYVYQQQLRQISEALLLVLSRLGGRRDLPMAAMGSGAFLATEAASRLGLPILNLGSTWDRESAAVAPSWAAAYLLAEQLEEGLR